MEIRIHDIDKKKIQDYLDGKSTWGHKIFGPIKDGHGYTFRIYAPRADRVFIKGDFNKWQEEELTKNVEFGYFFKYIDAKIGDYYKYIIESKGKRVEKTDPFAKEMDLPPAFASRITDESYSFKDELWLNKRSKNFDQPMNIYEIHVGSWKRYTSRVNFLDIVDSLIKYLKKMSYTHVELMPVTEHPYYPSWGYQSTGFFSTSSRFGSLKDLKTFVDILHQNDIGVILDFVLVHYAADDYSLKFFDGHDLYESEYKDLQYSQWGSLNFDYSKGHVRSFMKSAICFWLEECHFDGIRMDAISNMIFYDGNQNRGPNIENINFLKDLNSAIAKKFPTVMKIAEDSSSYPKVTYLVEDGGLGFDYKWDMGWMNDTIKYFEIDSINRRSYQEKINFSMFYFYKERYLLPLSHDEVVHLKKPMINKMNGSYEDRFKELKVLNMYQLTHPGKKLNFMGNDIATFDEWNENESINWDILKFPKHDDFNRFNKDLNNLYINNEAFYKDDYRNEGFKWLVVDDKINSVFAYERRSENQRFLVVLNMANVYHKTYQFPIRGKIKLIEKINSLDEKYGDYKKKRTDIILEEEEVLRLELWEYEAVVFEIIEYGR
ncbi:MAG: 1,4-alpha-glucan branching protein GlgB [Peptoniphilaceae bacterium]|nr:1,4-alpha-glucan branching protein GlgB [Peptoniphilaceae bacterium]MDY6019504.1 1,4-alpha-glucan branching protein GlgB [Anaerococcus sp.]